MNEWIARHSGEFFAFARLVAVLVGLAFRHRTVPKNLNGGVSPTPAKANPRLPLSHGGAFRLNSAARPPRLSGMSIELLRKRLSADRASFIEPCLPSPADQPPSGANWIHEIKHDGYRLMARRDPVRHPPDHPEGQRLDAALPARGRGGEPPQGAVVPDRRRGGVLRRARAGPVPVAAPRRNEPKAFLYAFDLLELDGD